MVRSTAIGGSDAVTGAAPASEDANTTAARLVAIGILSAVDEADRKKFDVRNRTERTARVHTVRAWESSSFARCDDASDARDGDVARRPVDRERRSTGLKHFRGEAVAPHQPALRMRLRAEQVMSEFV